MKLVEINISEEMLQGIDRAISLGYTTSRSEFIRSTVAQKLQELSIIQEMKHKAED